MTSRDDDADPTQDDDVELSPEDERAVSALLAALPPTPMPPEVLARIEQALAAEPALAAGPGVTTLAEARDRRRPSRGPLVFRVAASVVAVVGLTALGIAFVNSGGSTSGGSSAATNDQAEGAASVAASAAAPPSPGGAVRLTQSGRTYTAATLAVQAESLLTTPTAAAGDAGGGSGAPAASASGTPKSAGARGLSASEQRAFQNFTAGAGPLVSCVKELTDGDGRSPLAVDLGRWDNQAALVIVLPADKTSTQRQVFVVKQTCGSTDDSSDILQVAFLDS